MDERLTGLKVLIVDDDERNTFALASYLETCDFKISIAKNGYEALDQLKSGNSFDIILLDMMMPGMDGFELTRRIRHGFHADAGAVPGYRPGERPNH